MASDTHLRDVTEGDLLAFFEHQLDPEANRMANFPARDRDAFMAHWTTKVLGDEAVIVKTVVVDERVAGNVVSWSEQDGRRVVGYWIGREYWGKGIATKALAEFLGHERTRPLYAHVAKHNIASIRVLEKCGFTTSSEDERPSDAPDDDVEELLLELRASATAR